MLSHAPLSNLSLLLRSRVAGHKVFLFDKGDSLIGEPVSPLSLRVSNVDPTIVSALPPSWPTRVGGNALESRARYNFPPPQATIVSSSKQYLYTTTDAGDSWRRGKLPTASFSPESDIFLSHRLANTLALLSTAGEVESGGKKRVICCGCGLSRDAHTHSCT